VQFVLHPVSPDQEAWIVLGESNGDGRGPAELPAGKEARFHVLAGASSVKQMRCTVSWTDHRGPQESSTLLRLA
jgi:hypothetical protein